MATFLPGWLAKHTQYEAVWVIYLWGMHSVVYDMHMCKSGFSCWGWHHTHTHPVLASRSWEAGNTTTDNKATSGATSFQFINSPHTVCAIAHNSYFLNGCTQMVLWVSNGLSLYVTDATYTYSTLWKQHCMSFHSYHNYAISSKV